MRALASLAVISAALLVASCGDNGTANGNGGRPDAGGGGDGGGGLCPLPVDCTNPACASAPACQPGGDGGIDGGIAIATCGDGTKQEGEVCDDGNKVDGDGCDSTCTVTGCGNGVKTAGEACDDGNLTDNDGCDRNCTPTACGNGIKAGAEVCDDGNTTNWDGCNAACTGASVFTYVKASNTDAGDTAGTAVAISADGSTLAISAPQEASNATGVDGDQTNNAAKGAGAVYVFVRTGSTWTQQAYIKASNTGANDQFGFSLALSGDGSVLAVGATEEDSGDPLDSANNAASNAGAAYVYTRSGGVWSPPAYIKADHPHAGDSFGISIALSGDGKTLAVGADGEPGSATGINGASDTAAPDAGAAYVYTVNGGAWTQQAYVKASNTGAGDAFGHSVALSDDGATLAVGALNESSGSTDQADNSKSRAGAAYVFSRADTTWSQQAYVKSDAPSLGDVFGSSISLSGDGSTLAVGAENALINKGAAFVFARSGDTWTQRASLKTTSADARFGRSIALSADGTHVAIGADLESSNATGVGGDPTNTSAKIAGAAFVFANTDKGWTQQSYVKAFNTDAGDFFGRAVSLSRDGSLLAVGAFGEDSAATGLNGSQANDAAASDSGAAYVYQ